MDYKELCHIMQNSMDYANYIDITKTLDITDYYKTDTHWRQEKLPETAAVLAENMGASISGNYTEYETAASIFGGSAVAGYIIIGLLAFVLGVCVTILCFKLKAFQKKDKETGDGDGRVH